MTKLLRLIKIIIVVSRFGLDEFFPEQGYLRRLFSPIKLIFFWRDVSTPRGQRLRQALEHLGPIFVKFGQVLSTRRDLLPLDIADELAKLQDRVPPFPSAQVRGVLDKVYGKPAETVFARFDWQPLASASVAQVHLARLHDGTEVAVKVLRPNIEPVIRKDLSILYTLAALLEKFWQDGKRLKPREVVREFEKHLYDELDLMREAANASQLRRNFLHSRLMWVPEVYWDYCHSEVMVMQRVQGTPINQVVRLQEQGIDIPTLARNGVEIFFTQVFRDGFFHADMHPGNIFVSADGRYVAVDFGIMGTLTDVDKNYLAQNFLAFFRRDYHRVAQAHIEAGWAPADTRVDEFENAIRAVCEPIFDKPLSEISFGKVLLRLFWTSRRFNVEIQPQLVLLQKTLLNIEGLGRELDPDLDLWKTAKPYLERWMSEQVGWRGFLKTVRNEAPLWGRLIPQLPRLVQRYLTEDRPRNEELHPMLLAALKQQNRQLKVVVWLLAAALIAVLLLVAS